MAVTTLDEVIAGLRPPENILKNGPTTVAGRLFTLAYAGGAPGAIATPAAGVAGEALTTLSGQIPFTNPGGGDNSYLARFSATASQAGTVLLCDRLWQNSGLVVTSTSSQAVSSVAWPARDRDGTTDGEGIIIGVEVSTVLGAGTPTITLGYTNQDGTAGRSSVSAAVPSAMAVHSFFPLGLQAGDTGVRSVESFQLSATMTSGAIHLVAYRVLASVPVATAGVEGFVDAISAGLPRLYDNTVPFLLYMPSTTTAPLVVGQMTVTQG